MTDHPITPPPELVRQWVAKNYVDLPIEHVEVHLDDVKICTEAARWGADQELKACIEVILSYPGFESPELFVEVLRAARRPKPPSLKEQALEAQQRMWNGGVTREDWELVRRALEALDD